MIRVNLLRNTGLAAGAAPASFAEAVGPEAKRLIAAKLVLIALFPLAIFIIEQVHLNELEEAQAQARAKMQKLQAEKAKFGDAGPKVERYTKEKAVVDKHLEVIRTIARARLREVKALDAIQTLMPPKTWLRKLTFEGNLVRLEGFSSSDNGMVELVKSLESSPYFSRVESKGMSQESTPNGLVKRFELEFSVGKGS